MVAGRCEAGCLGYPTRQVLPMTGLALIDRGQSDRDVGGDKSRGMGALGVDEAKRAPTVTAGRATQQNRQAENCGEQTRLAKRPQYPHGVHPSAVPCVEIQQGRPRKLPVAGGAALVVGPSMARVAARGIQLPLNLMRGKVPSWMGCIPVRSIPEQNGRRDHRLAGVAIRTEGLAVASGTGAGIPSGCQAMVPQEGWGVVEGRIGLTRTGEQFAFVATGTHGATRAELLGMGGGEARLWRQQ
jgi:hypothetical protein